MAATVARQSQIACALRMAENAERFCNLFLEAFACVVFGWMAGLAGLTGLAGLAALGDLNLKP